MLSRFPQTINSLALTLCLLNTPKQADISQTSQVNAKEVSMVQVIERVCGPVSIICLLLLVITSVSQTLVLHSSPTVEAHCGENVTLTCEARSSRPLNIKSFSWLHMKNLMCHYKPDEGQLKDGCTNDPRDTLNLTLTDVTPRQAGEYLCKISTTMGISEATTVLTVTDCLATNTSSINESVAACWFRGVYPRGVVHWSQGDNNLTESAMAQDTEDPDGRFHIGSMIDVRSKNLKESYRCCLWRAGEEVACQTLKPNSTGSIMTFHWIWTTVGILVVKLLI